MGGFVTVHAENGDLADSMVQTNRAKGNLSPKFHALSRPEIVESEATGRAIDLAFSGNHPLYIVHMTCEAALNRVREATKRNQTIMVETCVQYLLLDDSLYDRPNFEGSKWVMSPPLRKKNRPRGTLEWNSTKLNSHCSHRSLPLLYGSKGGWN